MPRLPRRKVDAHKANVGRVLLVGGTPGMAGAIQLAALGALRAGAGLVRIALPETSAGGVSLPPEALTLWLPLDSDGPFGSRARSLVLEAVPSAEVVVLGPGAGRSKAGTENLRALALAIERTLVLDADGLFAFSGSAHLLASRKAATVITPHEGEAARLLETTPSAVRGDRRAAARRLAQQTRGIVVLKGPESLVTDGTREFVNPSGGPVLATGGTGDVLAGMVGALAAFAQAQAWDLFQAVALAVHAHGRAAERVSGGADRGILASEIAAAVPATLVAFLDEES